MHLSNTTPAVRHLTFNLVWLMLSEPIFMIINSYGMYNTECPGVVDWRSEIVNNDLIEELRNCTVITGSIVIGPVSGFE